MQLSQYWQYTLLISGNNESMMMTGSRLYLTIFFLISMLLFLQYRLWFQPGGIRDMRLLKHNLKHLLEENHKLNKRNQELLFQIKRQQNSHDAVEARARNELGMIKQDEIFYQIVK